MIIPRRTQEAKTHVLIALVLAWKWWPALARAAAVASRLIIASVYSGRREFRLGTSIATWRTTSWAILSRSGRLRLKPRKYWTTFSRLMGVGCFSWVP